MSTTTIILLSVAGLAIGGFVLYVVLNKKKVMGFLKKLSEKAVKEEHILEAWLHAEIATLIAKLTSYFNSNEDVKVIREIKEIIEKIKVKFELIYKDRKEIMDEIETCLEKIKKAVDKYVADKEKIETKVKRSLEAMRSMVIAGIKASKKVEKEEELIALVNKTFDDVEAKAINIIETSDEVIIEIEDMLTDLVKTLKGIFEDFKLTNIKTIIEELEKSISAFKLDIKDVVKEFKKIIEEFKSVVKEITHNIVSFFKK